MSRRALTIWWLLIAAAAALLLLGASARADIQTYQMPEKVSKAPVIDGVLEDEAWRNALKINSFRLLSASPDAKQDLPATVAHMTYDQEALYIAFRCDEPLMEELVTNATDHDGPTWMDDGVEIFLNPSGDRTHYVQLAINTAGVVMDGFKRGPHSPLDLSWETDARVGVSREDQRWQLEMKIPLAGLPLGAPDAVWTFHLARNRRAASQLITSLQSMVSGYHEIDAFDRLSGIELPSRAVAVVDIDPGNAYQGINLAAVQLRNFGTESETVQAVLTLRRGSETMASPVEKALQLAPNSEGTLILPWSLDAAAAAQPFEVRITVRSGDVPLRRFARLIESVPSVIGPLRRRAHLLEPHQPVVLEIPIRIGSGSRSRLVLQWQAFDEAGSMVGEGLTTVRTEQALVRLFWNAWYDGRYRLQLVLKHDGTPLATAGKRIRLVRSPWRG